MPHIFEQAPTGRAKCRGCRLAIPASSVRFGERLPNPFADEGSEMTHWFHVPCAAFRRPEPFVETLADPTARLIEGDRDRLEQAARLGLAHRRVPRISTAGRAPTGRATCRACRELVAKGAWRIALVYYEDGQFAASGFVHARCAGAYFETTAIADRLRHFSPDLTDEDLNALVAEMGA
jgi:hypothetical protein